MYGLSEKQLKNTFTKAKKEQGVLGLNFLILLESRLDNIVYRMGLASTRRQARQFVNHGQILVNDKKIDIPSYKVKVEDKISVKNKFKENVFLRVNLEEFEIKEFVEI